MKKQQSQSATPNKATQESNVRTYNRIFPTVFSHAKGVYLMDNEGNQWLDFLSGAGALNYGHNHPTLKHELLRYIEGNGIVSSLDLNTTAKQEFLIALNDILLEPRQLNYRCQFCAPTGTDTVEAALKLARKVTDRKVVISFSNSYHGMSAGSMSASASLRRRSEEYLNPEWVTFLPFDGFSGLDNEMELIRAMLTLPGNGIGKPAAFIIELVQGEGGVNIASHQWVQQLYSLAQELGSLFIVDEIQSGCGRTGKFFSFEHYNVIPDIVCVSKSISGLGLPMGLLLLKPELDIWNPGEHCGTFRGFNYGFVTATAALRYFWNNPRFIESLVLNSEHFRHCLKTLKEDFPNQIQALNHLGMIAGLKMTSQSLASSIQRRCFSNGLIFETSGPDGATLKLLPPLTITTEEMNTGMAMLCEALTGTHHNE